MKKPRSSSPARRLRGERPGCLYAFIDAYGQATTTWIGFPSKFEVTELPLPPALNHLGDGRYQPRQSLIKAIRRCIGSSRGQKTARWSSGAYTSSVMTVISRTRINTKFHASER